MLGSIGSFVLSVLYAVFIGALLVLAGAIVVMVAKWFSFDIDWNVQRLYLLVVAIVVVYHILAALFGLPTINFRR